MKSNLSTISELRGVNIPLWKLNKNEKFSTMSVKSTIFLPHSSPSVNDEPSPYKHLYNYNIPKKCKVVFCGL